MSLMQAICTRESTIHKSFELMKGCELMSNRSDKMQRDRTATVWRQNQMLLMEVICIWKSKIDKSLRPMKGCESTSNRSKKTHCDRSAILLCQNQMLLMQAICRRQSHLYKSLYRKKQSRNDAPERPNRASKTHGKAARFPEPLRFVAEIV
jgi:hypothetical protein